MKKIYMAPCVELLYVSTEFMLAMSDGSDATGNVGNVGGGVDSEGGDGSSGALTGGYREWDNIWGK